MKSICDADFDILTRLSCFLLGVQTVKVQVLHGERETLKTVYGIDAPETADPLGYCARVAAKGETLLLFPNHAEASAWSTAPPIAFELPIRFFVGIPLRTQDGRIFGVLYGLHPVPHAVSQEQLAMVELLIDQLGVQLELRKQVLELDAQAAQRERERATLLAMLDQFPAMISFWTTHEINVYANERHHDYFGVKGATLKGRHIRELIGTELYDRSHGSRQAALRGAPQHSECTITTAVGCRDFEISQVPYRDGEDVTGLMVLVVDVTHLNRALISMTRSEATQRALLAAIPGTYLQISSSGRLTALFGRTSEDLGIHSEERMERPWRDLPLAPDFQQLFDRIEAIQWSNRSPSEVQILEQTVQVRGEARHLRARVTRPDGSDDRVCLLLDHTGLVEAEAKLASSQSLLAAVTKHAPIGIIVLDAQDQVLFANTQARLFAALIGHQMTVEATLAHSYVDDQGRLLAPNEFLVAQFRRTGTPIRGRMIGFDTHQGERRWVEASITSLPDQPGQALLLVCDVTVRRQQEQALQDYSAYLDALIHAAPDGILTTDVHGNIMQANATLERLFGYGPVEVLGQNIRLFIPTVAQCLNDRYVESHAKSVNRGIVNREAVALRKDGSTLQVEVSISNFRIGETMHYLAIIRDVSERLLQRARSEFMAMVSHELRAPLHAVVGMAEVLMEDQDVSLPPRQRGYLSAILDGARHLTGLVNDILDLSRLELGMLKLDLAPVSVQRLCNLCTAMVTEAAQRKRVRLQSLHRKTDLLMQADARRICQILLNLLDNAIKFTPSNGTVSLRVRKTPSAVEFRVQDTGIGIAKKGSERLFLPFSQVDSSKQRKYPGTGIGLYLSRRLASLHGGDLIFRRPNRGGSVFILTLPIHLFVMAQSA